MCPQDKKKAGDPKVPGSLGGRLHVWGTSDLSNMRDRPVFQALHPELVAGPGTGPLPAISVPAKPALPDCAVPPFGLILKIKGNGKSEETEPWGNDKAMGGGRHFSCSRRWR